MTDFSGPVVFFDGVCNLCNRTVQFIIRHDRKGIFRFASLQSKMGSEARTSAEKQNRERSALDSIILSYKGKYYTKSSAALKIGMLLGGIGWLLVPGYIFPSFIRDAIYDAIAKRRYQWFGRRDECMIPTPELRARFLDEYFVNVFALAGLHLKYEELKDNRTDVGFSCLRIYSPCAGSAVYAV